MTKRLALLTLMAAAPLLGAVARAQSAPHDPSVPLRLAQSLHSIFNLTIQDYFVASRWNRPGTANVVEVRTQTPFEVWGQRNLLRLSIPFRTASELGPGLSDVRLFDLLIFGSGEGFWGIGPAFNLGINRGPGVDTLQAGPAAAFIVPLHPRLRIGLLNQNLFSEQVALTTLQPILVYQPHARWTLSLGELPIVYNWKTDRIAVFSVGLQIGFMAPIAEQPVRFFVNPQFNTRSSTQLYQWTIASGITLPLRPVGASSN